MWDVMDVRSKSKGEYAIWITVTSLLCLSHLQGKEQASKTTSRASKLKKKMKGFTVCNSRGVAGKFLKMTDIRNKIGTFRDFLDLSPCISSASVNEVHFISCFRLIYLSSQNSGETTIANLKLIVTFSPAATNMDPERSQENISFYSAKHYFVRNRRSPIAQGHHLTALFFSFLKFFPGSSFAAYQLPSFWLQIVGWLKY